MIRQATRADLEAVVQIYNASIGGRLATADTDPVSVESRLAWFEEREPQHPIWVVEREGIVVAWLSFGKFYGRPAYAATAELGLYVAPNWQRRGIAGELLQSALSQAPTLGLTTLLGFVFSHNTPSVNLFQKYGFEEWGRLPRVAVLDGAERDLSILGVRVGS